MSCKFCGNPPCGNEWCPYSNPQLDELRALVKAQEDVPVRFSQEEKDKFTAAILERYFEDK